MVNKKLKYRIRFDMVLDISADTMISDEQKLAHIRQTVEAQGGVNVIVQYIGQVEYIGQVV
ncbi:MAG: hypothetical protein H0U60_19640 [Blastocatellia bacterium]|nr:hypothetical protein [Blastocatellia bacterium]